MTLTGSRFCVFCGQKPDDKTREHVVPYWLLEMTGDPNRTTTFGQNFAKDQRAIRFSWSSFVAPACNACNNRYSELEGRVKLAIEALQRREPLTVVAYDELLDWLDKVRIGVWLLRHQIENHPIEITANFHIATRIAEKDRMIAVYPLEGGGKGLNLFGTESLIFNDMPSCFGLRINNVLILSASADLLCAEGCGFPYAKSRALQLGGDAHGKMLLGDFSCHADVRNPITDLELPKPAVWLYQPIKLSSTSPIFHGGFGGLIDPKNPELEGRTLEGNERRGALIRQYRRSVRLYRTLSEMIDFDVVDGADVSAARDIVASIYDVQVQLMSSFSLEWNMPSSDRKAFKTYQKKKIKSAKDAAMMFRAGAVNWGKDAGAAG